MLNKPYNIQPLVTRWGSRG